MIAASATEIQHYLVHFDALAAHETSPAGALAPLRRAAMARFAHLGFPTPKTEGWRTTSVADLAAVPFAPAAPVDLPADVLERTGVAAWPAPRLVFVNGRLAPRLSMPGGAPPGGAVGSLAGALAAGSDLAARHLGRVADFQAHPFRALNTALFADGGLVHVAAGVVLEAPIHLVFVSSAPSGPTVSHPRTLVVLEPRSQATVVETYVGVGDGPYFTNALTEVVLGAGAVAEHYRVVSETEGAFHLGSLEARQERSSAFTSHSVTLGGRLVRNDLGTVLAGEGAEATLYGLYLAGGRELVDHHTTIDHATPHGTSTELYKGIVGGRAKGVFSGRIIVRPDAQKTDARQTNKNLLLSDDAVVDTRPELEILANDVKCAHGATLGQLEADALFYLRARGIPEAQARGILVHAFASDLVERVRVPELRALLDARLLAALPADRRKG